MNNYIAVLKKYAVFAGRAPRSEYWMFFFVNVLVSIVFSILKNFSDSFFSLLSLLYALATIIPGIAVTVRRLHDTSRSAWWLLIVLIPIIGAIVLLIFMIMDSTPGTNEYGQNPKESPASTPAAQA